ncbi:FAD-dependent oxidoreductase [Streptomyces misionensis]
MPGDDELRTTTGEELHGVASRLLADWHSDIHQLLRLLPAEHPLPLRVSTATRVEPWTDGPVTLLGDALHAMSPVLAGGANTAIRDAGEPTTALARARDHDTPPAPSATSLREGDDRPRLRDRRRFPEHRSLARRAEVGRQSGRCSARSSALGFSG